MTKLRILHCSCSQGDIQGTLMARSTMYDGTPFSLRVHQNKVQLNEPITEEKPNVDGWMEVEVIGEQDGRSSIVLPAPTIEFGKNLSVKSHQLMPLGVTIDNFIK